MRRRETRTGAGWIVALRRWPDPPREDFPCTVKAGPPGGRLRWPSSAGNDTLAGSRPAATLWVIPAPTSYAGQLPIRSHVSRQAGQVVGGRLSRPRAACGGLAGCWRRSRQNDGGGAGLQALVRQAAALTMPRAGRSPGRACRPGGNGSNHLSLDAGSRPWRPSWVAVRTGGQADAEVRGNFEAPARAATQSASWRVESTCG